jgi:hypothetical protein
MAFVVDSRTDRHGRSRLALHRHHAQSALTIDKVQLAGGTIAVNAGRTALIGNGTAFSGRQQKRHASLQTRKRKARKR